MQNRAKDFTGIDVITNFGGYFSSYDKTKIAPNVLVQGSKNVYKKVNGNIGVRDGLKRRGQANSALAPVTSQYVYRSSWGTVYPIWVANGKVQVEIETSTNVYEWFDLLTTTTTRWVFDIWWDNTLKKNKVIACDGTNNLYTWSGGVTQLASATATTITKTGTATWTQDHFENTSKVIINGTTYTYTGGLGTTTLTGVTPSPAAEPVNSYITDKFIANSGLPMNPDFLKVVNNRVFLGSYTSQLIHISSSTNCLDYTIPGSIIPGSPNVLTLDGTGKGIAIRQGNAHVSFGTDGWAEITFPTYTNSSGVLLEQITPILKPVQAMGAAYSHEFIANNGDNFFYLAQDQQLRYFGAANNSFSTVYPCLSQELYSEMQEEDFTNGGIKVIADRTYLTSPNTGNVRIYQVRQSISPDGSVVADRIWYPPFVLNATRIDELDGNVMAYSNANPQYYYVWGTDQWYDDSPSDEELPYTCVAAFAYESNRERERMQSFKKLYTEGYITSGSPLHVLINYDYAGSNAQYSAPINTTMRPAKLYSLTAPSLGDSVIGDTPIGDVVSEDSRIYPKFRSINEFTITDCFEYQKIYYSDTANSRWEILGTGTDARLSNMQPVQIINKK